LLFPCERTGGFELSCVLIICFRRRRRSSFGLPTKVIQLFIVVTGWLLSHIAGNRLSVVVASGFSLVVGLFSVVVRVCRLSSIGVAGFSGFSPIDIRLDLAFLPNLSLSGCWLGSIYAQHLAQFILCL
jgi:hypothetical protein